MRLLTDYLQDGFLAFQFNMNYSLNSYSYSAILYDYLKTLPTGSRVMILAENCTILYGEFGKIVENCPRNIDQLIILTTANTKEHDSKKYILLGLKNWKEHSISEKISRRFAENIYDKLLEKGHLNKLRAYGSNRGEIINYMRGVNDIVDVLYISQEGRSFLQYYTMWLNSKSNSAYRKTFALLSLYSQLDIYSVPIVIFTEIAQAISGTFSFDTFCGEYFDIIRIQDGDVRIRCGRILNKVVKNELGIDTMINAIVSSARMLAGSIHDREQSLKSDLFQRIMKSKMLLLAGFSKDQVLNIMTIMKSDSAHLSYYWIQYGIANREKNHYEEANNAFREAAAVRGYQSYQVQHAEAKNYMEWGIWELSHNVTQAPYYFEQGKEKMAGLIQRAPHRYFAYSVHSYVDMTLLYYMNAGRRLEFNEARYIVDQLITLLSSSKDKYSKSISLKFVTVCSKHRPEIDLSSIKTSIAGTSRMIDETLDADMLNDIVDA